MNKSLANLKRNLNDGIMDLDEAKINYALGLITARKYNEAKSQLDEVENKENPLYEQTLEQLTQMHSVPMPSPTKENLGDLFLGAYKDVSRNIWRDILSVFG